MLKPGIDYVTLLMKVFYDKKRSLSKTEKSDYDNMTEAERRVVWEGECVALVNGRKSHGAIREASRS